MSFILNSENKVNLKIPINTYNVLIDDVLRLSPKKILKLSTFIQIIIENIKDQAHASKETTILSYQEQLDSIFFSFIKEELNKTKKEEFFKEVTDMIYNEKKLSNQDITFKRIRIRLNNNLAYYFENISLESKHYYYLEDYLVALLNEYANLPYVQRELIFHSENISLINKAIKTNKIVKLKVRDNNIIDFIGLSIERDAHDLYNYFVGVVINTGANSDKERFVERSIRISDISYLKVTALSRKIPKEKLINLNRMINDSSIQFYEQNQIISTIKLTKAGINMYSTMLHLRPNYINQEDNLYTFNCSYRQLRYYFFKYGKEVEIITPLSLRQEFIKEYQEAIKNYSL